MSANNFGASQTNITVLDKQKTELLTTVPRFDGKDLVNFGLLRKKVIDAHFDPPKINTAHPV